MCLVYKDFLIGKDKSVTFWDLNELAERPLVAESKHCTPRFSKAWKTIKFTLIFKIWENMLLLLLNTFLWLKVRRKIILKLKWVIIFIKEILVLLIRNYNKIQ